MLDWLENSYKAGQLLPENFEQAVKEAGLEQTVKVNHREGGNMLKFALSLRKRTSLTYDLCIAGHDHSYFFIQTFGPDHIAYHSKFLNA